MLPTSTSNELPPGLLPPQLPAYLFGAPKTYKYNVPSSTAQTEWQPPQSRVSAPSATPMARRRTPTAAGQDPAGKAPSFARRGPFSSLPIKFKSLGGYMLGAGIGGGAFCGPSKALSLRLWPFFNRRKSEKQRERKTILIMMSNTGGGHKASAEAIKQAVHELYGDEYEVLVVDMWTEHTPYPFNQLPNSYSFLVHHPILWRTAYHTLQPKPMHYAYMGGLHAFMARHLMEAFDQYDPSLVVSVHPLMQHIPVRVLAARAARDGAAAPVPFATVVTDFTTCHNTWFYPKVNKCFVPTEFCRQLGLAMGLREEQLVVHGLPIRPTFSKKVPCRKKLRQQLGLDEKLPAVLMVGGGEGMGKLEATMEQLDEKLHGTAQVVVICGRNKKLLQRLGSRDWAGGTKVVPLGFVDNMHEWMVAVDAIITKAGPGTIAEALICGLPILLNGNIPCQEEGNIPYVVDNHVGAFETDPAKIADIMAQWLSDPVELEHMKRRSRALGRPQAVYHIAEDLAALVEEGLKVIRAPAAAPAAAALAGAAVAV